MSTPFESCMGIGKSKRNAQHVDAKHFACPRKRTLSLYSISSSRSSSSSHIALELPKAAPTSSVVLRPINYVANGSFTTTSSARATLRRLASSDVYGGSERSASPRGKMRSIWDMGYGEQSSEPTSPSSSSTPISIHSHDTVPSISRTASSFYPSYNVSNSSSSSALSDLSSHPLPSPYASRKNSFNATKPTALECLEKKSKFCTKNTCSTCKQTGLDFPRCGRCGEMWCSRECRLRNGAKKHVCRG